MSRPSFDLFLSYAGEDATLVSQLAQHLALFGVKVWHDRAIVGLGDSIRQKILDGIESSRYIGLIFSTASLGKLRMSTGYLPLEEYLASIAQDLDGAVRVIPIRVDDRVDSKSLPLKYRDRRYVDLVGDGYGAGLRSLLSFLDVDSLPQTIVNPIDGTTFELLPAGSYTWGSSGGAKTYNVSAFYLASFPVTNAQFARFLDMSHKTIVPAAWKLDRIGPTTADAATWNDPQAPVFGVSCADALLYAEWASARLPTAYEYEYVTFKILPHTRDPFALLSAQWFEWTTTLASDFQIGGTSGMKLTVKDEDNSQGGQDSRELMLMTSGLNMSREWQVSAASHTRYLDFTFRCAASSDWAYSPGLGRV